MLHRQQNSISSMQGQQADASQAQQMARATEVDPHPKHLYMAHSRKCLPSKPTLHFSKNGVHATHPAELAGADLSRGTEAGEEMQHGCLVLRACDGNEQALLDNLMMEEGYCQLAQALRSFCQVLAGDVLLQQHGQYHRPAQPVLHASGIRIPILLLAMPLQH